MSVSAIQSRAEVVAALREASARTGVDFGYLLETAQRESGLNPRAEASTSSAAGLFQFIRETWLATLKAHGAEHGLGAFADAIVTDQERGYEVADPALSEEILALRYDPRVASAMAAELARDSARCLKARLGQEVDQGMLYAAHFLGVEGAARLFEAAAEEPEASAASLFPRAAAANRAMFYDAAGAPRSAAALLAKLGAKTPPAACAAPSEPFAASLPEDFASEGSQGASSPYGLAIARAVTAAQSGAEPQPGFAGFSARAGGPHAALRLTPEIIQILAAFDPFPERSRRDESH